jgi:Rod binding domain-containing protein
MMDGEMARSVSRGVDLGIAEAMVEQLTFRRGKTGD